MSTSAQSPSSPQVGDVVFLKGGGFAMTLATTGIEGLSGWGGCVWHTDEGHIQCVNLPLAALDFERPDVAVEPQGPSAQPAVQSLASPGGDGVARSDVVVPIRPPSV